MSKEAEGPSRRGIKARSLRFTQEQIVNDPDESTFIHRETTEAGLDETQR